VDARSARPCARALQQCARAATTSERHDKHEPASHRDAGSKMASPARASKGVAAGPAREACRRHRQVTKHQLVFETSRAARRRCRRSTQNGERMRRPSDEGYTCCHVATADGNVAVAARAVEMATTSSGLSRSPLIDDARASDSKTRRCTRIRLQSWSGRSGMRSANTRGRARRASGGRLIAGGSSGKLGASNGGSWVRRFSLG